MNPVAVAAFVLADVVFAACVLLLAREVRQLHDLVRTAQPERSPMQEPQTGPVAQVEPAQPEPVDTGRHFLRDPREQVAPPPMVGPDTLGQWLKNYHPHRDDAWPLVVAEFYKRAASDPEVADYFRGVDLDVLQQHFMRALVLVSHTGVTRGLVDKMATVHATVLNSARQPITGPIYDKVIGVLVEVLREGKVPESALAGLGPIAAAFRPALVRG